MQSQAQGTGFGQGSLWEARVLGAGGWPSLGGFCADGHAVEKGWQSTQKCAKGLKPGVNRQPSGQLQAHRGGTGTPGRPPTQSRALMR